MMWFSLMLMLFSGTPQYWSFVRGINDIGCTVYDYEYISCPNVQPPPGAVPIPDDAVETIAPLGDDEGE